MNIKSIKTLRTWRGKRVLVRCDFNVPVLNKNLLDDYKIVRSLPTVRYLAAQGARVILVTHFGRPQGRRAKDYKLNVIKRTLERLLGKKILYVEDCVGSTAKHAVENLKDGQIILLENIRFYKEEEKNDKRFARQLAGLADIYVNDALAVSHRAHASVSAIQKYLPSYAGILLQQELEHFQRLHKPAHPFVVIMGGKKIETKAPVIKALAKRADAVLIGGMLAYDFLSAQNFSTGRHEVSLSARKLAKKTLGKKVILPVDFAVTRSKTGAGEVRVERADSLPKNSYQLDIGPQTIRLYARLLAQAKTIVWNGPLGLFEHEHFRHGTHAIARLVGSAGRGRAFALVGGGETITALRQVQMLDYVDWPSTGGGAMLAYLAGEKMPGLKKIVKS